MDQMRTLFVNPARPRKRRRRPATKRRNAGAGTKERNAFLRGKEQGMKLALGPRRNALLAPRRRNAGIVPFVANPLILNPTRRRRRTRRSNPKMTFNTFFMSLLMHTGGSGIGATGNILGLNKIENVWARNLSRFGAAVASGFLPPQIGGAAAGAFLYPVWQEIALQVLAPTGADIEADIDTLAADLEDAVNEYENDNDNNEPHWAADYN